MAKGKSRRKAGRLAFEANLLDGLTDPVVLIDDRRRVVDANMAGRELLGAEATGLDIAKLLESPDIVTAIDAALADGAKAQGEVSLPLPVARTYEMRVWDLPARAPAKAVWAMLILHDVTATRMAEQVRADFVSNVSHELRSPLSSLVGFIETLKGPARDDPKARARFLDIMESEARRMTRLINDLLALSKVETEEHLRPTDRVRLDHLAKDVAEALAVRAEARNMAFDVSCPPELPEVVGDTDELIQVLHNLFDNAIVYGREGTEVRVVLTPAGTIPGSDETGVTIRVENEGDGIDPEHLSRLTERFYRIDKGRSRSMGGTGLGLAIVKHIVGRHRGHLAISSTPGKNTVFTVYLPRADGAREGLS
jgi:two-component system, OmpR family, phosphate regulon sensor histidine kinase PhoR